VGHYSMVNILSVIVTEKTGLLLIFLGFSDRY
jgi:hypothetical protein